MQTDTAVCFAGQARSIFSSRVTEAQRRNLIEPLLADVFLVLSPSEGQDARGARLLLERRLRAVEAQLRPVSMLVARDDQMLHALSRLANHTNAESVHKSSPTALAREMAEISECARLQPLPSAAADTKKPNDAESKAAFQEAQHRTRYQTGACSPQLSLALRQRACLELIEQAEARRVAPYAWIVRARPDIAVPCKVTPTLVFDASRVSYVLDFLAFMPRAAATAVLRQVPLARRWNVSTCFDESMKSMYYATPPDARIAYLPWFHTLERCNPCVATLGGWRYGHWSAHVWSESKNAWLQHSVAYPAWTVHADDDDTVDVRPYPPFGNASNYDNPEVPIGALYPTCSFARSKQEANALGRANGIMPPIMQFSIGADWERAPDEPPRGDYTLRCYRAGPSPFGIGISGASVLRAV